MLLFEPVTISIFGRFSHVVTHSNIPFQRLLKSSIKITTLVKLLFVVVLQSSTA